MKVCVIIIFGVKKVRERFYAITFKSDHASTSCSVCGYECACKHVYLRVWNTDQVRIMIMRGCIQYTCTLYVYVCFCECKQVYIRI